MHPFQVAEETKQKVIRNNCFVLNNFIMCSAYEYIIFCWVMHDRCIIGDLLSHLNTEECRVHLISLVCDKKALQSRLRKDVDAGNRAEDIIDKSVDRISFYDGLDTYKDDVSRIAPEQAAELIIQRLWITLFYWQRLSSRNENLQNAYTLHIHEYGDSCDIAAVGSSGLIDAPNLLWPEREWAGLAWHKLPGVLLAIFIKHT